MSAAPQYLGLLCASGFEASMLTCLNSCTSLPVARVLAFPPIHPLGLTAYISVLSPAQPCSELIVAPPPPWPFSCSEHSTPEQPSTSVVAAFITTKQPNFEEKNELKKQISEGVISDKPSQNTAELGYEEFVNKSLNQRQKSGGLYLEEDDSRFDTIKRSPPG